MASGRVSGVAVRGIASSVPKAVRTTEHLAERFGEEAVKKLTKSIGVQERRVAGSLCSSDLCEAAAERLLDELGWERASVDGLIFVTQTPDYVLPATACSLHRRLGLAPHCVAFDVNLGCSGYVYGLWLATQLLMGGGVKRLLLLVGDTPSRFVSPEDRSTAPLFGDAGSATALEHDEQAAPLWFHLGTDGSGDKHLIIPAGCYRQPHTEQTQVREEKDDGNVRSDEDLAMNGSEVFAFTLREVPGLVQSTLSLAGWETEQVDAFVFHQANQFMLRHLARRMKLPKDRVPLCLEEFGNTSCASIPLTLTTRLADSLSKEPLSLLLAGFGVGWSWGAVAMKTPSLVMPPLLEVEADEP